MDQDRLKKLEKLKEKGIATFVDRFEKTHTLERAFSEKEGTKVRVAGRIMLYRDMGKLTFVQLQDQTRKMQVVFEMKNIGDEAFKNLSLLDLGDWLGIEGDIFTTHKGEISVLVKSYQLLSKALRPLPEKWHGIKDREACYRHRYLDLIMNEQTRKRFMLRRQLIKELRSFLEAHDFLEIETPTLVTTASGAMARTFTTHHNALDIELHLSIAPETYLKRATVGGFERVFEFAKCFRNEGIDPSHLQEFLQLEYYACFWNYEDNMNFTEKMLSTVIEKMFGTLKIVVENQEVDFATPWPRKKFSDLIAADSGIDIYEHKTVESLRKAIKEKGIEIEDMKKLGLPNLMDALYKKVSRPKLVRPTFVTHYPNDLKPLARRNDVNPDISDSFQLLVNGWEVVNAYSELVNPIDQRAKFAEQTRLKVAGDEEAMNAEEDFLMAMEHGMPPQSGWGMGIDRLITLLTGQDNLKDCVLFPLMRPEGENSKSEITNPKLETQNNKTETVLSDNGFNIEVGISYKDAQKLLDEHLKDPATRNHVRESEVVMRALAKRFGANEESWGIIGLLHDLDWDYTRDDIANHTVKTSELLKKAGMTPEAIQVIQSHAYGTECGGYQDKVRTRFIEYALAAGETITGLVYACALVRPSKKLADVEVSSVVKAIKKKDFARNCNREVIRECEKLGLSIEEFCEIALGAIQEIAGEINL